MRRFDAVSATNIFPSPDNLKAGLLWLTAYA
jgi:hypothetical protein